jgi:uncharacterized membrane protein SpoIIM required for sporulation
MVVESLENPENAEKNPKHMFFFGILYTSIAILISLWVFPDQASLVMIFLTVMGILPLFFKTIKYEEQKDMQDFDEKLLLKEHSRALSFFMYFFFGATISYSIWYVFLPISITQTLFSTQISTILQINGGVTGFSVQVFEVFGKIFLNNVRVLIFCLIFAFLYGFGAIFVLVWNASVIGAAIGNFIRSGFSTVSSAFGVQSLVIYFKTVSIGMFKYAIHGIPEILAYFVAGLAGGIISVAIIKHDFRTKNFEKILLDSSDLIIISVVLLLVAAFLEVFVTPIFF